jgi:hypothetical protein
MMATAGQTALRPGIAKQLASSGTGERTEQRAGSVLLLGGVAYAAGYLVVGSTQLSPLGGLFAIVGTALVFLGLRSIARQSL